MKRILVFIFSLCFGISFSQSDSWVFYKQIDGVLIETSKIECVGNELITFKFTNTNNYSVIIDFYEEVWIDEVCKQSGDSEEDKRHFKLNPYEEIAGSCNFKQSFYIGSKIKRGSKIMSLTYFNLKNISVNIAE